MVRDGSDGGSEVVYSVRTHKFRFLFKEEVQFIHREVGGDYYVCIGTNMCI